MEAKQVLASMGAQAVQAERRGRELYLRPTTNPAGRWTNPAGLWTNPAGRWTNPAGRREQRRASTAGIPPRRTTRPGEAERRGREAGGGVRAVGDGRTACHFEDGGDGRMATEGEGLRRQEVRRSPAGGVDEAAAAGGGTLGGCVGRVVFVEGTGGVEAGSGGKNSSGIRL
ncbi:uncharacterized protein LOC123427695 [Hordeum vulgare subsp. vulgare]|uniref:uncharacterized protein LOC123427691 n=1 Tax=Hordeum vulgare subsp. vulgare TaxID=112509 RepID=UPI001D1A4419|nr:uncharacterized protein LOC123427691 [Hordeum vulgare subsp. vulgare]XP_044967738.1 uncharacterized protein LOC123427694 [Hordeum vulgare subsp. vulgare]XP_044967740.1 uncharacterized protein LOC123427695 [Hordeum vulgare subsp. vulgare]